jgi:hypothetical protein
VLIPYGMQQEHLKYLQFIEEIRYIQCNTGYSLITKDVPDATRSLRYHHDCNASEYTSIELFRLSRDAPCYPSNLVVLQQICSLQFRQRFFAFDSASTSPIMLTLSSLLAAVVLDASSPTACEVVVVIVVVSCAHEFS